MSFSPCTTSMGGMSAPTARIARWAPAELPQRRVRAQRPAHHDDQPGQREQRDNGAGGAIRRVKLAFHQREDCRRDQQVSHDERQFADQQRRDGSERAEPLPPGERAHDAP
jgi:hypothetical protein